MDIVQSSNNNSSNKNSNNNNSNNNNNNSSCNWLSHQTTETLNDVLSIAVAKQQQQQQQQQQIQQHAVLGAGPVTHCPRHVSPELSHELPRFAGLGISSSSVVTQDSQDDNSNNNNNSNRKINSSNISSNISNNSNNISNNKIMNNGSNVKNINNNSSMNNSMNANSIFQAFQSLANQQVPTPSSSFYQHDFSKPMMTSSFNTSAVVGAGVGAAAAANTGIGTNINNNDNTSPNAITNTDVNTSSSANSNPSINAKNNFTNVTASSSVNTDTNTNVKTSANSNANANTNGQPPHVSSFFYNGNSSSSLSNENNMNMNTSNNTNTNIGSGNGSNNSTSTATKISGPNRNTSNTNSTTQQQQQQNTVNANANANTTNDNNTNAALRALIMFEADVEKQFQKCQRMQQEVEEEKRKYVLELEEARKKRVQMAYEIATGVRSAVNGGGVGNGTGTGTDFNLFQQYQQHQFQQQQHQFQLHQQQQLQHCQQQLQKNGFAPVPLPTQSIPAPVQSTSSFPPSSALDALALACAAEKSLISTTNKNNTTTNSTGTSTSTNNGSNNGNDKNEMNDDFSSPRSILDEHNHNDITQSKQQQQQQHRQYQMIDESVSPFQLSTLLQNQLQQQQLQHAQQQQHLLLQQQSSMTDHHPATHAHLNNPSLQVPYRILKTKSKKLSNKKANAKARNDLSSPPLQPLSSSAAAAAAATNNTTNLTTTRLKSNRNLQLPTHELELALLRKQAEESLSGGIGLGSVGSGGTTPGTNGNDPTTSVMNNSGELATSSTTEGGAGTIGESNFLPLPCAPQPNASSSQTLLLENVAPVNENDDDFASSHFRNGNWSSNVTINDVLCGRGGLTNNHPGNVFFRSLVRDRQELYLFASKRDKALVAHGIVDVIRSLKPPGRFLKKDKKDVWIEIGNKKAREKTSQALREKAPELMEMLQKDYDVGYDNVQVQNGDNVLRALKKRRRGSGNGNDNDNGNGRRTKQQMQQQQQNINQYSCHDDNGMMYNEQGNQEFITSQQSLMDVGYVNNNGGKVNATSISNNGSEPGFDDSSGATSSDIMSAKRTRQ